MLVVDSDGQSCINYDILQFAARLGFASFATISEDQFIVEGCKEEFEQQNALNELSSNCIHEGILALKDMAQRHYGQPIFKSYYAACSSGNREVLKAAIHHPEDFDGYLLSASSVNWMQDVLLKELVSIFSEGPESGSSMDGASQKTETSAKQQLSFPFLAEKVLDRVIDMSDISRRSLQNFLVGLIT